MDFFWISQNFRIYYFRGQIVKNKIIRKTFSWEVARKITNRTPRTRHRSCLLEDIIFITSLPKPTMTSSLLLPSTCCFPTLEYSSCEEGDFRGPVCPFKLHYDSSFSLITHTISSRVEGERSITKKESLGKLKIEPRSKRKSHFQNFRPEANIGQDGQRAQDTKDLSKSTTSRYL